MKLNNRETLLITIMVIAIGVWAFDQFYYTPRSRKIVRLKEEIQSADLKLKESLILTKGLETTEAEVSQLEKKLKAFVPKTEKGGEFKTFLNHLAGESQRLHMKIVSIAPQKEAGISPKEHGENPLPPYEKVPVSVVLHSGFNSIGDYLKSIEELPLLLDISGVRIEKEEGLFPLLKATITLTLYTHSAELK
jgi:Tfp pilus assembly protein PilO